MESRFDKLISQTLCEIKEAVAQPNSCAAPDFIDICPDGLITEKLDRIISLLEEENLQRYDWEFSCSDVGLVRVRIDTSTGVSTVFNLDGTVNTTAILEPCSSSVESDPVIICSLGEQYVLWIVKEDGVPNGITYFTDKSGAVITPIPITDYTIGKCNTSAPKVWSGTADDISTAIPFNSLVIIKPDCCVVDIDTSAGIITVPKGISTYSTIVFDSLVTLNSVTVSGNAVLCDPRKVSLILNSK
ncbi:MAG: hypothetical protein ACRDBG_07195 [Waterburya sp.]